MTTSWERQQGTTGREQSGDGWESPDSSSKPINLKKRRMMLLKEWLFKRWQRIIKQLLSKFKQAVRIWYQPGLLQCQDAGVNSQMNNGLNK